jgi:putative transposase
MGKYTKTSLEEKLRLIALCSNSTILSVARSNNLSYQTLKNWVDKFSMFGKDGLLGKKATENDAVLKTLHKENEQLKLIIAEKELEIRIKNELLKKTSFQNQIKL